MDNWREHWEEFKESRRGIFGAALTLLLILLALLAPVISPQDPYDLTQLYLDKSNLPPSLFTEWTYSNFMLGSDSQGRDMTSAILYGLRISLYVGFVSTVLSAAFGTMMGLLAGYTGGRTDAFIMRLADIQLSFPAILIALVIMSLWGQGLFNIIMAISIVNWVFYARTARGSTLSEREKDYVDAARATGICSGGHHVPGNPAQHRGPHHRHRHGAGGQRHHSGIHPELSGAGRAHYRAVPGSLINEGYQVLFSGFWWISVLPGLGLMSIVLGINLFGDRLRDVLNPRLKR
jgi:peptide/nickel transport system permease protein